MRHNLEKFLESNVLTLDTEWEAGMHTFGGKATVKIFRDEDEYKKQNQAIINLQ